MKQTESAVRMLISAYKAVLTNCYIKENLLGGGKRLVKGAALSSFLTAVLAGVSQSAVANDTELGTIEDTVIKQISDIQQQEDSLYLGSREKLTVTRDNLKYYQIQYESVPKLDVDTYTEFPDNSVERTYFSFNQNPTFKGNPAIYDETESYSYNEDIYVKQTESSDDGGAAIQRIEDQDFELKSTSGNIRIDAVPDETNPVPENGAKNDAIKAYGNGDIKLESEKGNITIYANNNGIDNDGKGDEENKRDNDSYVRLNASGSNIIHAGINRAENDRNGDGIRLEGKGSIQLKAGISNVITGYDAGVYVHSHTETNGKIPNDSLSKIQESEKYDYNILISANGKSGDFSNTIIGYNDGLAVDSTTSDVAVGLVAEKGDNYIEGKGDYDGTNGNALSSKGGTIDVLAQSGNNYITGKNGISSSSGNISLFATEGVNFVRAIQNGIHITADTSPEAANVKLDGDANKVTVQKGDAILIDEGAVGRIEIIAKGGNNLIYSEASDGSDGSAIKTGQGSTEFINIKTTNGDNAIYAGSDSIVHSGSQTITIESLAAGNMIVGGYDFDSDSGILKDKGSAIILDGDGAIKVTGTSNQIFGAENGIVISKDVNGTNKPFGKYSILIETENSSSETDANIVVGNTSGIDAQSTSNDIKVGIIAGAGHNYIAGSGEAGFGIKSQGAGVDVKTSSGNNIVTAENKGIYSSGGEINLLTSQQNSFYNLVHAGDTNNNKGIGIEVTSNGSVNMQYSVDNEVYGGQTGIELSGGSVNLTSSATNEIFANDFGIHVTDDDASNINMNSGSNYILTYGQDGATSADGINIDKGATASVKLEATSGNNVIFADRFKSSDGDVGGDGIYTDSKSLDAEDKDISLIAKNGSNIISAGNNGIDHSGSQAITMTAEKGYNAIFGANSEGATEGDGLRVAGSGVVKLEAGYNYVSGNDAGINLTYKVRTDSEVNTVSLNANSSGNYVVGSVNGITAQAGSISIESLGEDGNNFVVGDERSGIDSQNASISLSSFVSNLVSGQTVGISAKNSTLSMKAYSSNFVEAGNNADGSSKAIEATENAEVELSAAQYNYISGAVFARSSQATLKGKESNSSVANVIKSTTVIDDAGDLAENDKFDGKEIVSAIYAEEGAIVNINGESNYIVSSLSQNVATRSSDTTQTWERSIWAYDKGKINIEGYTSIVADSWTENNNAVAIVSGTKQGLEDLYQNGEFVDKDSGDLTLAENRANVVISYNNKDNYLSSITGNIISAYAGYIDIAPKSQNDGIVINGSLIAGNDGELNVDLGTNGVLNGHIDDYGDAGSTDNDHTLVFENQDFSSAILKGGAVNLTMGDGSLWNVTRQSWVTNVDVTGTASINLSSIESETSQGRALTIYNLDANDGQGTVNFSMHLDGNRSLSDMLYIKNADPSGTYNIRLDESINFGDIFQNGEFENLRFATIGNGNHDVKFNVYIKDEGMLDSSYIVSNSDYDVNNAEENDAYNGDGFSSAKPGTSTVEGFFSENGKPVEVGSENTSSVNALTLASVSSKKIAAIESETQESVLSGDADSTNAVDYFITGERTTSYSDAAKTVVDLSRANYANAVYMDTLNKRQGEARFVGDTDHGVWVRLRHDNIGKDDSFRTHNTMVEVGFEQRDVNDYGEFHTGFALDYMNGQIDYHTVDGDGDIERYGVWFYTSYLGNDGQYADLVLKYGHLKNDFGFNTKSQGEHVTGDYTNEVASISAEYGWKFSNSYNYYIEPQVQLQYSYVTGADYTTSQGTKVDLDSIHSLIGRVGFRAGKDFNTETPITAYIRGDVLHEFLGDQDIYAYDNTGVMDVTYENDDTWYSAGVGLSVQSSENTYFFIEGEQVFGADNDSTYTVSGGFKHSF